MNNNKILRLALKTIYVEIIEALVALRQDNNTERACRFTDSAREHLNDVMEALEDKP